jgi:predicted amino acid racemase/arginase family enzyme
MAGPSITIDLARIERNARTVVTRCAAEGIKVFGVTKGTCGMPQVARAMLRGGVVGIAESRFENIHRLRDSGIDCPIMLLRSPPLARAEDVVRNVDISLQSELSTMREISRVAERLGRVHDVILMIDLGDLREGIWPSELLPTVEQVMQLPGIRIAGVGTNLTCFGAILPTEENLGQLIAHAYKIERLTGAHLDWISGGNSSSLPLLLSGRMPKGINNLRIGEAILQGGRDTFLDAPWTELEANAFTLNGELLEVKTKPSLPVGKSGVDAFGQKPKFIDEGDRLRGIANIGREDVIVEGLEPLNPGIRVLGASSDHLVLDLTDAKPPPRVGDRLCFHMNYGAMLAAMTSEYIEKVPFNTFDEPPLPKQVVLSAHGIASNGSAMAELIAGLKAIGFSTAEAGKSCSLKLVLGASRSAAWQALAATPREAALGLIWIDAHAAFQPDDQGSEPAETTALSRIIAKLKPQISPENTVIVGLRSVDPAEATRLKQGRISVFTIVDIDARGIRDVMNQAIRIARAGTQGYHVFYSPDVTDLRSWPEGNGGLTVRETHQAMEAIASKGGMTSLSTSGFAEGLPPAIATSTVHFMLSAVGKQIL